MEHLVYYISLHGASALSVGFCCGSLFGIKVHGPNNSDLSEFARLTYADTWLYCPLRLQEDEQILELWSVSYRSGNLGTRALIVSLNLAKIHD
jgi:hypothetical protein